MSETRSKRGIPTPRKARTSAAICRMPFDNIQIGDYGIMVDEETVYLDLQPLGQPPQAKIKIPRRVFDRFVDWYDAGTIPPEEKRAPDNG